MSYQKLMRWDSERYIITSLYEADRSFTDLVSLTALSKSVLSQRLKKLEKEGKIKIVPQMETKRFLYHLIQENLDIIDEAHIKLHIFSKILMAFLTGFAKDPSVSDEDYVKKLNKLFDMLLSIRVRTYSVAPLDVKNQWLRFTLGAEYEKNASQLFPKHRNILKYISKDISPKELGAYMAKDPREAAKELIELVDKTIEELTQKS